MFEKSKSKTENEKWVIKNFAVHVRLKNVGKTLRYIMGDGGGWGEAGREFLADEEFKYLAILSKC